MEVLASESTQVFFRCETGVAQQEHQSQSSTLGHPSPEAGMGRLQTCTAWPGASRPDTTIPDSPKKTSVRENRSVRKEASPVQSYPHNILSVQNQVTSPRLLELLTELQASIYYMVNTPKLQIFNLSISLCLTSAFCRLE